MDAYKLARLRHLIARMEADCTRAKKFLKSPTQTEEESDLYWMFDNIHTKLATITFTPDPIETEAQ